MHKNVRFNYVNVRCTENEDEVFVFMKQDHFIKQ